MEDASGSGPAESGLEQPGPAQPPAPPADGAAAVATLGRADGLMDESEPEQALALYRSVTGIPDRDIAAAGYFGAGNALYRLDREPEARDAWTRATALGDTPVAYRAWRQVAAALVRAGELPAALSAYRECERLAPREDKAEIASRLGWLSKETGNTGAANRYFARSRGDSLQPFMTYLIIAVTAVISLAAMSGHASGPTAAIVGGGPLEQQLALDKFAVAHGELYRLLTVTLVHDPTSILHLLFNMYALWFAGQLVERMYGSTMTLGFYVLSGIAGSVGTYVFGDAAFGVGASGAIFGLFGVVLVATRIHHPVLDAGSRAVASQVGVLILLNLVLGFSGAFNVDNFAHLGGLAAGLWLGLTFTPGRVPTLASLWQGSLTGMSASRAMGLRLLGVGALVAVLAAGVAAGTSRWQNEPFYHRLYGAVPAGPAVMAVRAGPAPGEVELIAVPADPGRPVEID